MSGASDDVGRKRGRGLPIPLRARRAIPAALVALLIVVGGAWILPFHPRNMLWETAVWSLFIVTSFAGWGSLVHYFVGRDERVDLGLRVVWGASVVACLGGLLMVPAWMTRTAAMLLVEGGVILALAALVRERSKVRTSFAFAGRFCRRQPRVALVLGVAFGFFVIHYLGGIAERHSNPYDDDIAYFAFVKKLLDTGTVLEPFSFRRLSALGGQTLYVALVWLRAGPLRSHTFDRSICILIILLLVAGHRSHGRRTSALVGILALAMLLTASFTGINTASYYSGVAFFLGMWRTLVWAGQNERSPARTALPLALVAVTLCTLRQNYIPIPVLMLAASYGRRIIAKRSAWRQAIKEPLFTTAIATAAIVPWLIVSWQSNRTILYPFMPGTFNRSLALESTDPGVITELRLQVGSFLEGEPLHTLGFFVLAAAFLKETDPRRPLGSFGIGMAAGFALLVHGLTQGDPINVGRYAFGFVVAGSIAVLLEATTQRSRAERVRAAIAIVLFAAGAQIALSKQDLSKTYRSTLASIGVLSRRARPPETPKAGELESIYVQLQYSVPAGDRLAVLVDKPYHLDFKRNPIYNLDMPGYASLPPGIPFFQGSERVEEYFRTIGVRYLAFVRGDRSSYHYRRDYWVELLVDEMELWRNFAAYLLDFLDNLSALATKNKILYEGGGMVLLDLESPP